MIDSQQILNDIVAGFFYLSAGVIGILSLFGVYVLVSYGRSRTLAIAVSVIYVIIFLGLVGAGQSALRLL